MANSEALGAKNDSMTQKKVVRAQDLTDEQRRTDEMFMARCIQLARQGMAGARPNPMVGAVVVHDGKIIGEGYHIRQGGPHAEVNAIRSVKQPELLPESTIYVSLEPCAHYGKTPPCADLIVSRRIRRCVVGCQDPFAKVDGLGIKKLLDGGVEVTLGVREEECLALNKSFITFHRQQRPFITLKWAQSEDGYMDGDRREGGDAVKFSTPLTFKLMHRRRALSDAILAGGGTVLSDNPSLTVREWASRSETGNSPITQNDEQPHADLLRVVIDTHGSLPAQARIFSSEAETLVWKDWDLTALMKELHGRNIQRLLVEGGAQTLRRFLELGLWDEMRVETAPFTLGSGTKAPSLEGFSAAETYFVDGNRIELFYQ